jgi:hypothetical protein
MRVVPDMVCCKDMRQQFGLGCDANWMICCLAAECAKQPTLELRRRFAGQVSGVRRLRDPGLQEAFRAEVQRRYVGGKRTA